MTTEVIANFTTGLETDIPPYALDNDAFNILVNAYIYRGKVQKKRGSFLLGRLRRDLVDQDLGTPGASVWTFNIYTVLGITAEANAALVPGTVVITLATGPVVFTDQGDGSLTSPTAGNSGVINYNTGVISLTYTAGGDATVTFSYYPALPVLGLEDYDSGAQAFPLLVAFDQKYSYQFNQGTSLFYDTTFYRSTQEPFTFEGANYQQFWSENYSDVMFVCNNVPGLHIMTLTTVAITSPTLLTITTSANHELTDNDYVYINEVDGTNLVGVNGVSGRVTVTGPTTFTIPTVGAAGTPTNPSGIIQYLTRNSPAANPGQGIKFYTGDPTVAAPPDSLGWVNFAPPLNNLANTSVEYLAGARMVVAFKNRLLFFGIWVTTSTGVARYIQNGMVYSQDGTPFYASFNFPNFGVDNDAWFQNVVAKGGRLNAPVSQDIVNVNSNEDFLICGFQFSYRKLIFTGDDTFPFVYQTINSEKGSESTFSGIDLDDGTLAIGNYGLIFTNSTTSRRFDGKITDQVFDIASVNNGEDRVTAFRDYKNKFVYFTYLTKTNDLAIYPSQTLLYNYEKLNWAILRENYTHYGFYRKTTGFTWATLPFRTWAEWTTPWNFGGFGERYPSVVGGNQQGFVLIKDVGTKEGHSQQITLIAADVITSPDHCLLNNDYIVIENIISSTPVPKTIARVKQVVDKDSFQIDTTLTPGTYFGNGTYYRINQIQIRTKMFQKFWGAMKKTRMGPSYFLLENTAEGEVNVNIYVNQNESFASNAVDVEDYIPFTQKVLSRPEPGLNKEDNASYSWHKLGTSLSGDTFQLEFTYSDEQMRNLNISTGEFILHAIALKMNPGPHLTL